jgi:hypothetical protein
MNDESWKIHRLRHPTAASSRVGLQTGPYGQAVVFRDFDPDCADGVSAGFRIADRCQTPSGPSLRSLPRRSWHRSRLCGARPRSSTFLPVRSRTRRGVRRGDNETDWPLKWKDPGDDLRLFGATDVAAQPSGFARCPDRLSMPACRTRTLQPLWHYGALPCPSAPARDAGVGQQMTRDSAIHDAESSGRDDGEGGQRRARHRRQRQYPLPHRPLGQHLV